MSLPVFAFFFDKNNKKYLLFVRMNKINKAMQFAASISKEQNQLIFP